MTKITSISYDPKEESVNIATDDGDDITFDSSEARKIIDELKNIDRHRANKIMLQKAREYLKQYEPH